MANTHQEQTVRSIVLTGKHPCADTLLDCLKALGPVDVTNDLAGAGRRIEAGDVDLVICQPEFIERIGEAGFGGEAARILEALDSAACIFDRDGRLRWGNPKAKHLPPELLERTTRMCEEAFGKLEADVDEQRIRPRRFSMHLETDQFFEVTLTPIRDGLSGQLHVAGIVKDATGARRLQQQVDAIDRAGRELVRLDAEYFAKLDVGRRLALLEERIIRYTKDLLHFDNFTILLVDRRSNKLEPALSGGRPQHAEVYEIYVSSEGNGISGYVAATGRSYNCPDVGADPRYLPGIEGALSSLTVPLRLHDRVIGVFNVESTRTNAFTEDDRQFAEIFARYVALALNILDLLIVERSTTTDRLADNVTTEIAAPLNDIMSEASALMEEYIGHDDMRRRLQGIVDNATEIREAIKQVTKPQGGILGRRTSANTFDPVIGGKRVLLAEDEELIRDTIHEVLAKHGAVVETAAEGATAVQLIEKNEYDIVISDIKLPQKNGYEIFAAAKHRNPDLPVILMTGFGYDPNHSIIRARAEGLAAVLFKPFKVDEFLDEVRAALTPAC